MGQLPGGATRKEQGLSGLGRGAAGAEGREGMQCAQAVAVTAMLGVQRVREGRRLQKTILEKCDKGLPSLCLLLPIISILVQLLVCPLSPHTCKHTHAHAHTRVHAHAHIHMHACTEKLLVPLAQLLL